MENKFKIGEIVRAKVNPNQKLIVSRYVNRKYYCKIQEISEHKKLIYFERELIPNDSEDIGLLTSLNVIINK